MVLKNFVMVALLIFIEQIFSSDLKMILLQQEHQVEKYSSLYREAFEDREGFWAKEAANLHWFKPWSEVISWDPPHAKWFTGGKINASYNCLDRHLNTPTKTKTALIWEGERGEQRSLTYEELYHEVNRFSNVLKSLGIKKGDKVAIYLPMIPEAAIAMLSCARIGAVHTVVFGGFSADALKDRIIDSEASLVITADGGFRKGRMIPLKETTDLAIQGMSHVKHVIVVSRTGEIVPMKQGRDYWYHEQMEKAGSLCSPEEMDAEDELFILYTSGTTGKPKGILHTTAGYLVGVNATTRWVFDIKPNDVYWCTADIGWITGHSYVVYGPLSQGATQLMYEGSPDWPEKDRYWKLIEKYGVTILYTSPTAIRTFMKWGEEWVINSNLSSLRLLGSVGEPINPEAWNWYYKNIGYEQCPIVDTWWQTETGSIMIAPLPGVQPMKPGSATRPLPGIDVAIFNDEGTKVPAGYLAITSPWPSMLRGIYKNPELYKKTYWNKWGESVYFTGDGAKQDEEGYYWLLGRVDDVMNISGHRLSTIEIENAMVDHPDVAESAAIAIPHDIKGQGLVVFVSLKEKISFNPDLENILKQHIVKKIGAVARPERVIIIYDLPKTRSGKIMRRLLRDIAEGRAVGDVTTLADPLIVNQIKKLYQKD